MTQNRERDLAEVFASDVITVIDNRQDLRGEDDGLRTARAAAITDKSLRHLRSVRILGMSGQHQTYGVTSDFLGDGDLAGEMLHFPNANAVEHRRRVRHLDTGGAVEDRFDFTQRG